MSILLVDLAPAVEAGRRQKEKPAVIQAAEFFAAEAELATAHAPSLPTAG